MKIAAILPCRGRAAQTLECVRRLLATSGMEHGHDWQLICVLNDLAPPASLTGPLAEMTRLYIPEQPLTYWQSLDIATRDTDATHLIGLANDLLPGQHWLRRAVDAYQEVFGGAHEYGMLGFNGDSHGVEHSCHFLIDRDLLTYLGGWPVWYQHNYGDTELCLRATAHGRYAKAPWALLYHNHVLFGSADDATYAEGRASMDADERLFHERRRTGWPTVSPSSFPRPTATD